MKGIWKKVLIVAGVAAISFATSFGTMVYMAKLSKDGRKATAETSSTFKQPARLVDYASVAAENIDFTKAAELSVNAVVHIKSIANPSGGGEGREYFDPFEFFFGDGMRNYRRQPRVGFGSGVIISTDGYIVTNNHVIDGADEIEVTTNDDKAYKAKLIGRDDLTDVALLKIDGDDFPVISFGNSDALKVGEWVLAVGNPFNLKSTVTAGIVSATGRADLLSGYNGNRRNASQEKIESYIQTDAAVNPGNSGGALVNTRGELVGINTLIYSETGNFVGYSFAIPISIVKKVITDIKQYGIVQRAMLGVEVSDLSVLKTESPEEYEKLKVKEGVYVARFPANSSAQKAGIQTGDVITSINGTKIKNYHELRGQLSRYSPGNKVEVQIQRGNDAKKFTVELKNDHGTTDAIKYQSPDDILGASFKELTRDAKLRLGINFGVEVTDLKNGKLKDAGIKNGFIILTANDNRISTSDNLIKVVEAVIKKEPDDRGLYIKGFYPDVKRMEYIAIDLND
ncbi:MAG: Do family serine endopeptidase [Tannerella sp.]|jgi:Do/DeqQ family serine protease|nr:Do family serine endopeptidase [Tannerella sp.]